MSGGQPRVVMEEVTDPIELAEARVRQERFDRNWEWFQGQASEIFQRHRGKCICIAGQELFVADTPEEVRAMGNRAYPDDNGSFLHYIPRDKVARIYADSGAMVSV